MPNVMYSKILYVLVFIDGGIGRPHTGVAERQMKVFDFVIGLT
jgi:hypothetical protein